MVRYKHVNYDDIAYMVLKATQIKGSPQPLRLLVNDLSRHMDLGIDASRVARKLGSKVVERYEDYPVYGIDGNVETLIKKVTTMVVP